MPRRDTSRAPRQLITLIAVAVSGWWLLPQFAFAQEPLNNQNLPPEFANQQDAFDSDVEPLARGPVHEAFLSPHEQAAQPSVVIEHQPPEPIDEIPPEAMPEGNPVWIPGYWMWSETENDFIWVSGVWREAPPDQRWVPGYWEQAEGGWRWVAGFWATGESNELMYLAPPPESLEQGPSSPAPSDEYFWVPGCWIYQAGDYAWRPGYWAAHQPGWIWVPNYYVWTPRGVVFCGGYWDFPVERRGTLFSPVWFRNRAYLRPGFRYTPHAVVVSSRLLLHLFVGPRWHHYYWGNYYGDVYTRVGLRPWFAHRSPMLNYYSWHFGRQNVRYVNRLESWFHYQNRHPDYRPPILYRQQLELAQRADNRSALAVLTRPLREVASDRRFVRLDTQQRQRFAEISSDLRTVMRSRVDFERRDRNLGPDRRGSDIARGRFNLPEVSRVFRPITRDDDRRGPRDGQDFGRDRPDFRDRIDRDGPGRDGPGRDGPGRDVPGRDGRPNFGRPGFDGRPDSRPGTDRPGTDRPGLDRPGLDRPGLDRPGLDRPGRDGRPVFRDRPGTDRPGADRPGIDRPGTDDRPRPGILPDFRDRPGLGDRPGVGDRPGRDDGQRPTDRMIPGARDDGRRPGIGTPGDRTPGTNRPGIRRPDRFTPDSRTPGARTPDVRRPDQQTPGTQQPSIQRPDLRRPSIQRPDTQRPGIQRSAPRPGTQRPSIQRPTQRPSVQQPSRSTPGRSSGPSFTPGRSGSSRPSAAPSPSRPSFTPGRSGSSRPSAAPSPSRPSFTPSPSRSPGRSAPSANPGGSRPSFSPGPSGGSRGPASGGRGGGRGGRGGGRGN